MIEQYVYNKITSDTTLQALLSAGGGKYHLYAGIVPRGIDITKAVTFTLITTVDAYPNIKSANIQFNIFAKTYTDTVTIAQALEAVFNGDNNKSDGGVDMIFSIRKSESYIGHDYDDGLHQREATYYFKLR